MDKLLQIMMVASCGGGNHTTTDAPTPSPDATEKEVGQLLLFVRQQVTVPVQP